MITLKRITTLFLLVLSAITGNGQVTRQLYLSGHGPEDAVKWDFFCTDGQGKGKWTTIPVPSCWELQGFGKYNYGRDPETQMGKETGLYRYRFTAAEEWKGKQVEIVFEGSMTDTEVKINGRTAGPIHQGAFYQFRYDISKLLKYGRENLLEVTVKKHSDDESVNRAERQGDYWNFGGIFRPVYLEIKPAENISRVALDPKADGRLTAEIYFNSAGKGDGIEIQLFDITGKAVSQSKKFSIQPGSQMTRIKTDFQDVKSWNPEWPVMYILAFRLFNGDKLLHETVVKTGFRTVEVKERDGIYVNGTKIKFKGVNRHSFRPETGRTLGIQNSIEDILLMKEMNMNAVRMSHYPPDSHFLDMCDSIGLFVIDELAGWQKSYETEPGRRLLKEMVCRDVNHPSIVIWSNGNEAGWNNDLNDDFEKYDPQKRIVIHPHAKFRKTDTNHYPDYNLGTHDSFNGSLIFFPTEFLHGLYDGGLGAGLDDFWNLMLSKPRSAGGFLWVFADEAVVRTDMNGALDNQGNLAPDGILGPHHEKEGSFFAIKEIWSPVYFEDKLITGDFDGCFRVENRFLYTSLKDCTFEYEMVNFPGPDENKTGNKILKKGVIQSPDINPGESGILMIDLPREWRDADAIYIRATDPYGREIWTWDWPVTMPADFALRILDLKPASMPFISEKDNTVVMEASGIKVVIDKNSGVLQAVTADGRPLSLNGGPAVSEGNGKLINYKLSSETGRQIYEADFEGTQRKIRWILHSSGILQLNFIYNPNDNQPFYGMNFSYPEENVKSVRWLGDGPCRVWKNRLKGTRINVWEKVYNNTITGESFEYPEFKGFHSGLYWAKLVTSEGRFSVFTTTENLYLRLYTPGKHTAPAGGVVPPFPQGDISFLQSISAIGTKFKKAEQLGPQSQLNTYFRRNRNEGNLETELFFDFRQ